MIANYNKFYIGLFKNDFIDAFIITDFARVGRIPQNPWSGMQFLTVQLLTRHSQHITLSLSRNKTYMVTNVFLKFSELARLRDENVPFANNYGAIVADVLTDFLSVEDIANTSLKKLIDFICKKATIELLIYKRLLSLQREARDSHRLDKALYKPLTVDISSSFKLITAYNHELKAILLFRKALKALI